MTRVNVIALPNVLKHKRDAMAKTASRAGRALASATDISRMRLAAREWHRLPRNADIELHANGVAIEVIP